MSWIVDFTDGVPDARSYGTFCQWQAPHSMSLNLSAAVTESFSHKNNNFLVFSPAAKLDNTDKK